MFSSASERSKERMPFLSMLGFGARSTSRSRRMTTSGGMMARGSESLRLNRPLDCYGQRHAWREKANFWPSITRRDAPLCCKRRGRRGESTSPPWRSVCTAYGDRDFARQADSVRAASNLGRPAGCRASFSIAAVAGGCAWSRDPVVAIERWSSVLCLLLLAVRM